jgi:aldose 1-epimerase
LDDRLTLRAGAWEAVILPAQGAALAALRHAGRDILVPVPPGADPNRGRHGAFLMVPWTNRLDGGRLPVGGTVHRMPVNWPDGTAIHGLVRDAAFAVEMASAGHAVLVQRLRHPPFDIETRVEVALGPERLRLDLAVRNRADAAVPTGLGWHPFFVRPAGTRIRFRAAHVLGRDARTLPTAARPTAGIAGGEGAYLGLDDHFAGWDGAAEIAWPDGTALRLSATGACARNLHLFAPHETPVICAEPVSHAPDAPNRAAAAQHGALHPLAPGAARETSLQIHLRG